MYPESPAILRVGFFINPWAGIGGTVALKGSDGASIKAKAIQRGAKKTAINRAGIALKVFQHLKPKIKFYTVAGEMGGELLNHMGFNCAIVYITQNSPTTADDSIQAIRKMQQQPIDLLVFAGGDGTARDVYDAQLEALPVIGIPAGTKIHSGVYCITPRAAGELITQVIEGKVVGLTKATVMDIDEDLFRRGKVQSKLYGELNTADEPLLIQASKSGSIEDELISQLDLAEGIVEEIQQDHLYLMGSGTTVATLMEQLTLENTLLGIDVMLNHKIIGKDVTADQLHDYLVAHQDLPKTLYLTVIGGQGHVFGRGNQQLTPEVLKRIGRYNIQILATKAKLASLNGRPLIADTGDEETDNWLSGRWIINVGYKESVLYPMH